MRVLPGLLLAVALFNLSPTSAAPQPKEPVASAKVQKEFAGFIEKFRAALKANDAKAVASLTKMPFMSHTDEYDAAAFQTKVYKKEFIAKTRACIARSKAVYDRAPDQSESYSIFCGDEIFMFTKTPEGFLFTEIGVND